MGKFAKGYIKKSFEQVNIRIQFYMKCACCGGNMLLDKELEKIVIYKCRECGLSNTEVKKNDIGSRK